MHDPELKPTHPIPHHSRAGRLPKWEGTEEVVASTGKGLWAS